MNKLMNNLLLAIIVAGGLVACGGGGSSNDDSMPLGNGMLSINITDAPIDSATEVVVKFDAIEINPQSGELITVTFSAPKMLDLLSLQNGETAPLLQDQILPAGDYSWIRLMVDADQGEIDSYIKFMDGSMHSLYVPSGSNTGLKLNRGFTIAAGASINFTLDFDLRKSVHMPMNNSDDYFLRPTIRMMDHTEVGTISGYILPSVVADASCQAGLSVYAYNNADVAPDDEGSATSPLTSSMPEYDATNDRYSYSLSYLLAGDYTIAVTCDADMDDAEVDETEWGYITKANATVTINQVTQLNFE
jgi:hypothetical protein